MVNYDSYHTIEQYKSSWFHGTNNSWTVEKRIGKAQTSQIRKWLSSSWSAEHIIMFEHKLRPGMKVALTFNQRVVKHNLFLTNFKKEKVHGNYEEIETKNHFYN